MLIQDADQPAIWYHRLKKAWAESVENGTAFVNPVKETTAELAKLGAAKRGDPPFVAPGSSGVAPAPTPR